MTKFFHNTLAALLMLCALTACDKDAADTPYNSDAVNFTDTLNIGLYVPDKTLETDPHSVASCLDTVKVETHLKFTVDTENKLGIIVNTFDPMTFSIPFLEADGSVREAFADGYLNVLLMGLERATNEGKLSTEALERFKTEIEVLCDTIDIEEVNVSGLTYREAGAMFHSWNAEQSSAYSPFTLKEFPFTRSNNITKALSALRTEITTLNNEGFFTDKEKKVLTLLYQQRNGGTLSDANGNCTFAYANAHVDFDLRLKEAEGVLDVLSYALFGGTAETGPTKNVWLVMQFNGNAYDPSDIQVVK